MAEIFSTTRKQTLQTHSIIKKLTTYTSKKIVETKKKLMLVKLTSTREKLRQRKFFKPRFFRENFSNLVFLFPQYFLFVFVSEKVGYLQAFVFLNTDLGHLLIFVFFLDLELWVICLILFDGLYYFLDRLIFFSLTKT